MIELDAINAVEARAALERESRNNPTINRCLYLARITGLSAEDTYSMLAYELAIALDRTQKVALELANTQVSQPFIMPGEHEMARPRGLQMDSVIIDEVPRESADR